MKVGISGIVILVLFGITLWAQNEPIAAPEAQENPLLGHWEGSLTFGGRNLRIAFHIFKKGDGYQATMDSIDQGAMGIPVKKTTLSDRKITFELPRINAKFEGTLTADNTRIDGNWKQGITLRLALKKVAEASKLHRPQTPKAPFPYRAIEVRIPTGPDLAEVKAPRMKGTLTLPEGAGPFPALLLIGGTIGSDRDLKVAEHRPFLVIADHLTRRGFATLRFEPRPAGPADEADAVTWESRFSDVQAAFAFLKAHPEADGLRCGLLSHGAGALYALRIATSRVGCAFVAFLSAPGVPATELMPGEQAAVLKANGATQKMIDHEHRLSKIVIDILAKEDDSLRRREQIRDALLQHMKTHPQVSKMSEEDRRDIAEKRSKILAGNWFREFVFFDPRPLFARIECPSLFLHGELDLLMDSKLCLEPIAEGLIASPCPDWTIARLPRLNHLLQRAKTGSPAEFASLEETMAPVALARITSWLSDRFVPREK